MKKLIATTLAVAGMALYAGAQGTFQIDSSANATDGATPTSTTGGLVFLNGVKDTATDINLAVFWGTSSTLDSQDTTEVNIDPGGSAGYWSIWQSDDAGSGDITFNSNGTLSDPNGNTYTISTEPAATTVYMVIEAWTGDYSSYAAALAGAPGTLVGETATPFAVDLAANSSPSQPLFNDMPSLNLTAAPEPATLAFAGLGGLSVLLFRRRK